MLEILKHITTLIFFTIVGIDAFFEIIGLDGSSQVIVFCIFIIIGIMVIIQKLEKSIESIESIDSLNAIKNMKSCNKFKKVNFEENNKKEEIKEYARKSKLLMGFDHLSSLGVLNYEYKDNSVKIMNIQTEINMTKKHIATADYGLLAVVDLTGKHDNFTIVEKKRLMDKIFARSTNEPKRDVSGLRDDLKVLSKNEEIESIISEDVVNILNKNNYLPEMSIKNNILYLFFNHKSYDLISDVKYPKSKEELNDFKNYLDEYLHPIIKILN